MKHFIISLFACCLSLFALAQVPHGINYQAVVRDGSGVIAANAAITVQLTIHEATAGGAVVYQETHTPVTNDFGLVNLVIGEGTVNEGVFSNIDWKDDVHFLQVEVNTGDGLIDAGTQQLISVPYAFAAEEATNVQLDELTDVTTTGATSGQVLEWNGTEWAPATDNGTAYTAGSGINIAGTVISNAGDTDATNDVLTTTTFGGDVSGVYNNIQIAANAVGSAEIANDAVGATEIAADAVGSAEIINGGVTTAEILDATIVGADLSQMSATSGQVLEWNGTAWAPATDNGTAYTAGSGITIAGTVISNSGDTDAANDVLTTTSFGGDVSGVYSNIQIAANAVGSAEIANDAVGSTEIANGGVTTTEILDATILGADIGQMSATSGQVLEWNGTAWAPATDNGTAYTAGSGINIAGTVISNAGDTDASNDVLMTTTFGGDVSGVYSNIQIAANAVGSAEIANNGVTTTEILDATIVGADLNQMSATSGQVLEWNGTAWAPATDNGSAYTAGTGINIDGTVITNTGDPDESDDANTTLNNLVPTAVNVDLDPLTDDERDLGSTTRNWQDIYLSGDIAMDYDSDILSEGVVFIKGRTDQYDSNMSFGMYSGTPTTGFGNTLFGYYAGNTISIADDNVAVGKECGKELISGSSNTLVGTGAGRELQSGYRNCHFGAFAGTYGYSADNNTYIGYRTGRDNVDGSDNVIVGCEAGIGGNASNNTIVGSYADAGGGGNSVCVGSNAGESYAAATENTFVGANSGSGITSYSVCVGFDAGGNQSSGDQNTFVGYSAEGSESYFENAMALGYQATVNAGNRVRVGNSSVLQIGGQVAWSSLSDARFKKNIHPSTLGLAFIKQLQPVNYNFIEGHEGILYTGFLAQDVEKILIDMGEEFSGITKPENATDSYSIRYAEFVVPLVKAVQELNEKVEQLQAELETERSEKMEASTSQQTVDATTVQLDQQRQMDELKKMVEQQTALIQTLLISLESK